MSSQGKEESKTWVSEGLYLESLEKKLSKAKKDIACLEEISNQHAIDAVNYRKEAEDKDKEIESLKLTTESCVRMINEQSADFRSERERSKEKDKEIQFLQKRMSDAAIAAKQFVDSNFCALQAERERSKEWKMWAEKLARYIECPTIFLSGEPSGNGLLSDFQKFKESQGNKNNDLSLKQMFGGSTASFIRDQRHN